VPAVAARAVEEGAQRLRRPGLDLRAQVRALLRRIGRLGDVASEQLPAHGIPQRAVQDEVEVAHRPDGQTALAVDAAVGQQVQVEVVEHHRVELLQRHGAEPWDDVQPDVAGVAGVRAGSHGHRDRREPSLLEVLADGQPCGRDVRAPVHRVQHRPHSRCRLSPRGEPALRALAPATGARVELAVVVLPAAATPADSALHRQCSAAAAMSVTVRSVPPGNLMAGSRWR
jgi:hypothetical protein